MTDIGGAGTAPVLYDVSRPINGDKAEVLGVERSNLYKKLRAFGITPRGGT